jgi:hypothetical protein
MKTLISLWLALVANLAVAQDTGNEIQRKAFCMDRKDLETLVDRFSEIPLARGINVYPAPSSLVIFVNPDTGSYSVVERVATDQYCVLGVGGSFESVPADIQKNSRQRQEKRRL